MTEGLKPYPEYKDSGVPSLGKMPSHWTRSKLRHLLARVAERNRPDLPLLSVVRERGVILRDVSDPDENHNFIPDDLRNYKVVRRGQFAMNKMKAWQGSYGVSDQDGIVSPAYFVFNVRGVQGRFFHAAIRSRSYVPFFTQASDGVRIGQWDLSETRMREIPFLMPPTGEQAGIVRFLDHSNRRIRRYVRAKQKLIALLEEQKRGIIYRAVTRGIDESAPLRPSGVDWTGAIPSHWSVQRLKWVTRLQRGYDLPAEHRVPGPYPVVSSGGVIGTHADAKCSGPGVVMGRYGSTDAVFYVEDDFWPHNTSLFVTDFHGNSQRWCYYLLRSISKADHAGKSAVPGVDRKDLFDIPVPLPPVYEQERTVEWLERAAADTDRAITLARGEVQALSNYRNRLVADVVTGKLDVREAAGRLPQDVYETEAPVGIAGESDELDPDDAPESESEEVEG